MIARIVKCDGPGCGVTQEEGAPLAEGVKPVQAVTVQGIGTKHLCGTCHNKEVRAFAASAFGATSLISVGDPFAETEPPKRRRRKAVEE